MGRCLLLILFASMHPLSGLKLKASASSAAGGGCWLSSMTVLMLHFDSLLGVSQGHLMQSCSKHRKHSPSAVTTPELACPVKTRSVISPLAIGSFWMVWANFRLLAVVFQFRVAPRNRWNHCKFTSKCMMTAAGSYLLDNVLCALELPAAMRTRDFGTETSKEKY